MNYKRALLEGKNTFERGVKLLKPNKSFNDLSKDMIYSIAKFLPYFYILVFIRVNRFIRNSLNKFPREFKDDMINMLKDKIPNSKLFVESLSKHKHYIGGSAVLQCLLGEYWEDSDLDVYHIAERNEEGNVIGSDILGYNDFIRDILQMEHKFLTEKELKNNVSYGNIARERNSKMNQTSVNTYPFIPELSRKFKFVKQHGFREVKTYSTGSNLDWAGSDENEYGFWTSINEIKSEYYPTEMDYVVIDSDKNKKYTYKSIFDFYNRNSDLSFCANIFDGKDVYIKDFKSILNKITYISNILTLNYNRGQVKYGLMDSYNDIDLIERLKERIDKYEKRGFQIEMYDRTYLKYHGMN